MTSYIPSSADIVIIGAGMAGASLAGVLAPFRRIVMIEAEDMPGYHATGRSAAFWQESYGGVGVQPLTSASEKALARPDPQFSARPFLQDRTALVIGRANEAWLVDKFAANFRARGVEIERLPGGDLASRISGIRPEWSEAACEPSCQDIDVGALHQAYLLAAKRNGARLVTRAPLVAARRQGGQWQLDTPHGQISAPIIVNAAGAWADDIARLCAVAPVGIQPFRRTMVQVRLNADVPASLPLIAHVGGDFYFKGAGAGRLWLSPHDEAPSQPCDAAPDDWDVALAIDRLQSVADWPVAAVERKWAGLRSFAPDRLPVFGADPDSAGFIWCAGQGGFGIQTAPAIAALLSAELGGAVPDDRIAAIDPAPFSPRRFRA